MEVPARKALYNLLLLAQSGGLDLPGVAQWEVCNYREVPQEELFAVLHNLGCAISPDTFAEASLGCSSPEVLANKLLSPELDDAQLDRGYLTIFELWRRLRPELRPLSIFCDDLDHVITCWYSDHEAHFCSAKQAASALIGLLIDADQVGMEPETLLATICHGCSNHVEGFIYDLGRDLLEEDDIHSLQDLICPFRDIVKEPRWIDLLRAGAMLAADQRQLAVEIYQCLFDRLMEDWLDNFAVELIQDLMEIDDLKRALRIIEHGIDNAKQHQELTEYLELAVIIANGLDLNDIEPALSRIWQCTILQPLDTPSEETRAHLQRILKGFSSYLESSSSES